MVKKLLTLALGLTLAFGAMAQTGNNAGHKTSEPRKDVVFPASDVQYWVGSGSNSAVVIAAWDDNPNGNFALVWGVHWNGSTTALGLIDSIAVHDSRFSYSFSGSLMQGVYYTDDELISGSSMGGWCYYLNGSWAMNAYSNQPVTNGDVIEISSSCMFTMTTAVAATDPNAAFSCLKAQAVSVTGITTTNATVNITDTSNVNDYTVMLYAGDSLVDSTVIYTQTISYTTLTANTGYTVKVYSNCTDGTQTSSRNASFRTPCVTIEHAELPWVEDFQSYNGQSYASASVSFVSQVFCWDLINPYSDSDPYINSSSSVNPSGGKCLYASSRVSSPTIFVLPPFEDTPDQLQLSFDVLSTYGHGFEAGVIDMTDSTFTPVALCLPNGSGWNHFEVTFAGITEGRLALRRNDNSYSYLDNVTVAELPSCVKPSQVLVSDVTASSATLTITDPNSSNHYMIYVAEDSVEIYTDTYTLSDLLPNTRYVVNVKTLCSDTTTGTTETSFRTACGPIAIPYHEDFSQFVDVANGYGYPVTDSTLPCWGFLKGRALDRLELFTPTQSSTYSYGEDGYTLRIYGNNSDSRDLVVLPELEQEINTLEMSFMARPSETGSFGGTLQVGYVTDADDSSTFVAVGNYPCAQFANGYDLCANTFLDAPTGARIALRYLPSGGSAKSWYIDEIDVHDMPACVRAQSISVDNIGTNGFTLHVADPTLVNHYRYYLVSETSADSADFYDTVTTVSDIAASTDYQLQVVSICNDGTLTLPLTISVSTLCAPVTEVPFVENFENWTATQSQGMNRCWNRLYNNSSSSLVTNNYPYCASGSGNALNGFKSLKMYSKGTSNGIKEYSVAYLPEFEASVTDLKVRFFYKYTGTTYNISKVKVVVGVSDSVADTTTFTRLATLTPTEIGWNEFEVELSGYTGTGNRITIMQTSTGTTAITSYIDSMVVDTVSSCNRPATFTVDTVTAYGADLTWTDPSEAGTYIVRWSDGTNVDSATVTGETTYALTNLSPSTNYTVDIRSICWGNPTDSRTTSFATACAPMPLPWSMNFDNIINMNQLSSCWNRYSGIYVDSTNSASLTSTTSGWTRSTTAFDGSSHVKINIYGTSIKYWLVTPQLNLTEDAELSFDYMLTAYGETSAPETGAGFDDDRFVVLATTDDSVWTPLAKWGSDTERDDYALASVTNTVSHANISLSAFTGQVVRLAFYAESTVRGTDNDFCIDNLMVAVPDTTTPIIPTPEDASIAASDILYWVGDGSNQVVLAVNWADTALAWGYRFSTATVTVQQMMDDIAAADPRFSYTGTGYITDINYIDTAAGMTDTLGVTPGNWWWSMLNHVGGMGLADVLHNGDFYKWGDLSVAVVTDSTLVDYGGYSYWDYTYVWPYTIHPVSVPISDTTIIDDSIRYWVGAGEGSAIVEIAWEEDGVSLAWGVHFDEDYYPSPIDLLDSIDTYDPRFDYQVSYYMSTPYNISSISFTEGDLSLSQTNTSNIVVRCLTSFGDIDAISGSELEDYSVWSGDTMQISTSGLYDFSEVVPVNPPAITPEPQPIDTLCSMVHTLPYEMDFSGYTDDQSMRVYYAGAPVPECWSLFGNGRFHQNYDTTATASIYFGGIGYATSTNNYGCMEVGNPYLALIVCQGYDGTYESAINNVHKYGTKRYAVLPAFNQSLGQTMLTFNYRTTLHSGAELRVGYIVNDTSDFVALDTIFADYRVTHNDTVRFTQHEGIPAAARLTFLWMSTDTAHTGDYPANYYCGIDNLVVALDTASSPIDTVTPEPPVAIDATLDSSDILFWVGHGENQVVMAVNWADTALAWGYRFESTTVTAQQMMDDIAAVDPRFSYVASGFINDINYIDTAAGMTDTLGITPGNYWWSLLNHVGGWGLGDVLHNGDFYKWGDLSVAVVTDSTDMGTYMDYTYVWPYTIYPVTVPDTTNHTPVTPEPPQPGSFCGAVGTEGCTAIKADSSAFVAWATGVSVTRGPKKISDPSLGVASTGADSNAIGMATLNDVFDVVSLGDGGSALVTFANPIRNGEGPDFAVFENGFSDNSLELAFVEVSSDGERFVRFPATCLTQTETQLGNAGQTDPTNLNNLAGKYRIGYGTPFDLEELRDSTGIDIDSIVYVRVVDVVGCIDPQYGTHDQYGNIINDPWPTPFESSGYDLTGVGVIYERIAGVNYYTVAVNTNDSTMGSVTGGGSYAENSQVVLTASPNEGYHFVSWSNGEMTASISILVTSDTTLTATFAANDTAVTYYTVALSSNNSDWGMVVGAGTYAEGTVIEIKAVANEGYHFVDWNDGVTDSVRTITVTADMQFVANFAENTGIDDVMATVEALWPNPTADYVNVSVNRKVEAVLYDLSGRRMAAYTLNEGNNTLNLSALQRGVYMLRIEGMVSKIVKR